MRRSGARRRELLRMLAVQRLARGDAVTLADLEKDRRPEAEGGLVFRAGCDIVIDLRAERAGGAKGADLRAFASHRLETIAEAARVR